MKYCIMGSPDKLGMTFKTDRVRIDTITNINLVIGVNGCGKSYLLDAIDSEFQNDTIPLGYDAEEIFNKYFAAEFFYKCGDGYHHIMEICKQLASGKEYICIKNPESFLHISVQEKVVYAIHDLFDGTEVKVFIETQSPHIVNGHFDNVVEAESIDATS